MRKIKSLMPSLREKKRYIAFEVMSNENIDCYEASREIVSSALSLTGTLGVGAMGFMFLPENYKNNKGILRVNHNYLNHARASLALIKEINKKPAVVRSLSVSGAINKMKEIIAG